MARSRYIASTPGVDPGGDYARAFFVKADGVRPGAQATLTGRAALLLGGSSSMTPQACHSAAASIFLGNHADALLYYCSGTQTTAREVTELVSIPVPDGPEVGPVYGLAIMSNRPEVLRLALFMFSERGQAIIAKSRTVAPDRRTLTRRWEPRCRPVTPAPWDGR